MKKNINKDLEDIIYFALKNYDLHPISRAMAKEITRDVRQYMSEDPTAFEGIYRRGKYYRKMKDGSYYSADGMCYLKKPRIT